jgi:phage terminase large subunit GpA-like protein
LNFIECDQLAQGTMEEYGLTSEDMRRFYLAQPHFDQIFRQLIEQGDDFVNDPVETLLQAVRMTKAAAGQPMSDEYTERRSAHATLLRQQIRRCLTLEATSNRCAQRKSRKLSKTGKVRNSVTMFLRLLTS